MYSLDHYGVVYTPEKLASFVADLIIDEYDSTKNQPGNPFYILDPACGEGILLKELSEKLQAQGITLPHCFGIDVDAEVISANRHSFDPKLYTFFQKNSIIPSLKRTAWRYWSARLKNISCVIANPPWSAEKVFCRSDLDQAGYHFDIGQYDSYVLFIELCLHLVDQNALLAFIVPDSLFSRENKALRKYLLENMEVKVLARLGEKLFPNVNRATSVIVLKNCRPSEGAKTRCYRLDTSDRKDFLNGTLSLYENFKQKSHTVLQKRFLHNQNYVFDIDARENEEQLLRKIEAGGINWEELFRFGRGIEISKSGAVVTCEHCGMTQTYLKKQLEAGIKTCQFCSKDITLSKDHVLSIVSDFESPDLKPLYVGENLHRYQFDGIKYIKPNVMGINYKNEDLYRPPKILIRKTGLGIYACIDYNSTYTSQTVYSVNYLNRQHSVPLEYYLGILNSRLIYYYYLKKYGENEWKSHPYLTKEIIFSLPIKAVSDHGSALVMQIAEKAKRLQEKYERALDIQLEKLIMDLYEITDSERAMIESELNSLPNLSAINPMKLEAGELHV